MDPDAGKFAEAGDARGSVLHGLIKCLKCLCGIRKRVLQDWDETEELLGCINDARTEWLNANMNFNYAEDSEVIDYYTYKIKASEIRYEYYLKKAREMGIKLGKCANERVYRAEKDVSSL